MGPYTSGLPKLLVEICLLVENAYVLWEIHEGVCSLYIDSRALATLVTITRFYWPMILNDVTNLAK
jgi:hypothetical protein